ncbi:DUF6470 family protein [Mesobacillus foraminis]|uniref:DUF6470 family protein n=1 Tax=Mesobacillus foraminis TaxID=279826 RepID=UPI00399FB211
MQLPQIRLQSTFAQTAIRTTPAKLEIQQSPADLTIEQPKADLSIERTPSRLTIDQTKAREDVGMISVARKTEMDAQQGHSDLLAGISRRVQEGNEMMRIEDGGNPIASQAKRNLDDTKSFNIGWIPSPGSVKVDYSPSKVEINWKVNKPVVESRMNKPEISYTPGKAEVSLKNHASLKIDFDNLKYIGTNYEQSI